MRAWIVFLSRVFKRATGFLFLAGTVSSVWHCLFVLAFRPLCCFDRRWLYDVSPNHSAVVWPCIRLPTVCDNFERLSIDFNVILDLQCEDSSSHRWTGEDHVRNHRSDAYGENILLGICLHQKAVPCEKVNAILLDQWLEISLDERSFDTAGLPWDTVCNYCSQRTMLV